MPESELQGADPTGYACVERSKARQGAQHCSGGACLNYAATGPPFRPSRVRARVRFRVSCREQTRLGCDSKLAHSLDINSLDDVNDSTLTRVLLLSGTFLSWKLASWDGRAVHCQWMPQHPSHRWRYTVSGCLSTSPIAGGGQQSPPHQRGKLYGQQTSVSPELAHTYSLPQDLSQVIPPGDTRALVVASPLHQRGKPCGQQTSVSPELFAIILIWRQNVLKLLCLEKPVQQ
eukprot:358162-Chlamydomonas_euryale.AAC.4